MVLTVNETLYVQIQIDAYRNLTVAKSVWWTAKKHKHSCFPTVRSARRHSHHIIQR